MTSQPRKTWAGNLTYSTSSVHTPNTVEEVQEAVKKCNSLRVLGSRCTFNNISDSKEHQISLEKMNKVVSLNKTNHTVTVEGGITYGELGQYLHENGYALHNLASLPHITIAGACSTATHGSGVKNGCLTTAVNAIEFVNASGEVVTLSRERDGEEFLGAVASLGCIGVITKLTLDLQPTFDMTQHVYLNLPMEALKDNFMSIVSCGYSVSLFTDWSKKNINSVWIKSKVGDAQPIKLGDEFFGAKAATVKKHPCDDTFAANCTDQLGTPGAWYTRITHFKFEFRPSVGAELQSEHFVPIDKAYEAIMAIESLADKITPNVHITEIRTVKADNHWMSPCYQRDSIGIHFTWKQDWAAVSKLLPQIEAKLAPFNPRPHWGKLFMMSPSAIQASYPKLNEFKKLVTKHDPKGKFRKGFVEEQLYAGHDLATTQKNQPRPRL